MKIVIFLLSSTWRSQDVNFKLSAILHVQKGQADCKCQNQVYAVKCQVETEENVIILLTPQIRW